MKMHILIVNSSSFKMTLSNNQCKHFYIRSKLIQWRKETSVPPLPHATSSELTKSVQGSKLSYRHAGVLVYGLYSAVHIQGINVTPNV